MTMKKKKFLPVMGLLAAGLLSGCVSSPGESGGSQGDSQGGDSSSSSRLPSSSSSSSSALTSSKMSREEILPIIGRAYYALFSSDNLGVDLSIPSLSFGMKEYERVNIENASSAERGELTRSAEISAKNLLAIADADGLQDEGGANLSLSLKAEELSVSQGGKNVADSATSAYEDAEAGIYVVAETKGVYLDLSQEASYGFIESACSALSWHNPFSQDKYLADWGVSFLTHPYFGKDFFGGDSLDPTGKSFAEAINKLTSQLAQLEGILDDNLEYISYSDGTYGLKANIETLEQVVEIIAKLQHDDDTEEDEEKLKQQGLEYYAPYLPDFGGLELSLSFDSSGRLSSMSIDGSAGEFSLGQRYYAYEITYSLELEMDISFRYGEDSKVSFPEGISEWQPRQGGGSASAPASSN